MRSRVHLRPAYDDDIDFLDALYAECMREYSQAQGQWDPELFRRRFIPSHVKVILCDQKPVGLIKVFREPTEIFLGDIQIDAEHQNQGIGGMLVQSILDEAADEEKSVRLNVLKGNPAIRLYRRLGFEVYAESPCEYRMRAWPGRSRESENRFVPLAAKNATGTTR